MRCYNAFYFFFFKVRFIWDQVTAISTKNICFSKCVNIVELMLTHFENKNIQGLVVIIDSFICNASKRLFSSMGSDAS